MAIKGKYIQAVKKENVMQLKIEESNGETFLVDDKKSKKELIKKEKLFIKSEKQRKKQEVKKIKAEKQEKRKNERERHKINYLKKLQILKKINKERKEKERQEALDYERRMSVIYKKRKIAPWLRLDNAGTIYPSATRKKWNFVYRITAVTKNQVNVDILNTAIGDILPRFPSFNVCLKKGLFWNYFERAPRKLTPIKDIEFPCQPFDLSDSNANLIRVIYDDYKICFECFHALSDGRGSLMFLNSLLARYFILSGHEIKDMSTVLSYKDMPTAEELEDSFLKYANNDKTKRPKERAAYKIKGDNLDAGVVNSLVAEFSVKNLKDIAKKLNCSLTVLLTACIGYISYLKKNKTSKKPIRISVPIDCRTRLESSTLRNFSTYINIDVEGENLTLEDCIEKFKQEFAKINNEFIQSNINANVKLQTNIFIKILPRFIKSIALKNAFNWMGENYQTLAFSNLGCVNVPEEFKDYVERYEVNLGRSGYNTKSIGVISFGDKLTITFSSNIEENETEKDYFTLLANLGANIKIYSNRRDIYDAI